MSALTIYMGTSSNVYSWHRIARGTVTGNDKVPDKCRRCGIIADPAHMLERRPKTALMVYCGKCCPCFENELTIENHDHD